MSFLGLAISFLGLAISFLGPDSSSASSPKKDCDWLKVGKLISHRAEVRVWERCRAGEGVFPVITFGIK